MAQNQGNGTLVIRWDTGTAAAPAAPAEDDQMTQLQNLAALHTQGVLSDEEFAAAKAKVLGI